jgi:hypothetical protein
VPLAGRSAWEGRRRLFYGSLRIESSTIRSAIQQVEPLRPTSGELFEFRQQAL